MFDPQMFSTFCWWIKRHDFHKSFGRKACNTHLPYIAITLLHFCEK